MRAGPPGIKTGKGPRRPAQGVSFLSAPARRSEELNREAKKPPEICGDIRRYQEEPGEGHGLPGSGREPGTKGSKSPFFLSAEGPARAAERRKYNTLPGALAYYPRGPTWRPTSPPAPHGVNTISTSSNACGKSQTVTRRKRCDSCRRRDPSRPEFPIVIRDDSKARITPNGEAFLKGSRAHRGQTGKKHGQHRRPVLCCNPLEINGGDDHHGRHRSGDARTPCTRGRREPFFALQYNLIDSILEIEIGHQHTTQTKEPGTKEPKGDNTRPARAAGIPGPH